MQLTLNHKTCHGKCGPLCNCPWTTSISSAGHGLSGHYLLASGSAYRAELLRRLQRPFSQFSPDIDESAQSQEPPAELATRLARQKACAWSSSTMAANDNVPAIIIASDQVASVGDQLLGKPGTIQLACEQLASMSAQPVTFFTALHMLEPGSEQTFTALDVTTAQLRKLSGAEIARYVEADQPLDCAGSFKVEALGISLFESVESRDPTALIGLPMIALCQGLRELGLAVP